MFLCGNFAPKPLQIGEIMSNNKIMQFSYFYWNANEKKGDEKTTIFHDEICHDCDLAWCFWKMHHGILFARRLGLTQEINGDGGSIWWAPGISHDASRLISVFSPRRKERSRVSREISNDLNFKMQLIQGTLQWALLIFGIWLIPYYRKLTLLEIKANR